MGKIRCLHCRNELSLISGMACPNCGAKLSHVLISFLTYLGPEDSLNGYQRSYKLVFLKCLFTEILRKKKAEVASVTETFIKYYKLRKRHNLIPDKNVDSVIANIDESSLRDVWMLIERNPYSAISKKGFVTIRGEGLNGFFVLQKGIDGLSIKELGSLINLLDEKLDAYYRSIGSVSTREYEQEIKKQKEQFFDRILKKTTVKRKSEEAKIKDSSLIRKDEKSEDATVLKKEALCMLPSDAESIPLEELSLSVRAYNVLKRNNVNTLEELQDAYEKGIIPTFRNLGRRCFEEIRDVLISYGKASEENKEEQLSDIPDSSESVFSENIRPELLDAPIEELFYENAFQLFRQHCAKQGLVRVKDLLGVKYTSLIQMPGISKGRIQRIKDKWMEIADGESRGKNLGVLKIHESNRGIRVSALAFAGCPKKIIGLLEDNGIHFLRELDNVFVPRLAGKLMHDLSELVDAAKAFEKPYIEMLPNLFDQLAKEHGFEMFLKRAEGKTLQEIGDESNITRERVRQVSNKLENRMFQIVRPLLDQLLLKDGHCREEQIREIVSEETYLKGALYAIRQREEYFIFGTPSIVIDKRQHPNADLKLMELSEDIVGDGIDFFESEKRIEEALEEAGFGFLSAADFLDLLIKYEFVFYGDYVVRNKKAYGLLCSKIVETEYPDGIKNDAENIAHLRKLANEKYGDLEFPESDRSFFTRVSDYLVLRGRALYISPKNIYGAEAVMPEIKQYIDNSEQQEVFYSEIFAEYEGLLMMTTNIDNPQFLHGALKYYCPDDYTYSRDCIRKESGQVRESLGERIKAYIDQRGKPVTKKELKNKFPGITDAMFAYSIISTHGLMQWEYNLFNSINNLNVDGSDVEKLRRILAGIINKNDGYCSEALFFDAVCKEASEIIERNSAGNSQNIFYIAAEYLAGDYEFKRPHIASAGRFSTMNMADIALELINASDQVRASDYFHIAEKYRWSVVTAGMSFGEIEERFVRITDDLYISPDRISITDNDVSFVKEMLEDEANGNWYIALRDFAKSEEALPCGYYINEFLMGSIASLHDLGWHIVSPKNKDRRFQRGILVKNDVGITEYDHLVAEILRENEIVQIGENELLTFLLLRNLTMKNLHKELYESPRFKCGSGVFEVL